VRVVEAVDFLSDDPAYAATMTMSSTTTRGRGGAPKVGSSLIMSLELAAG